MISLLYELENKFDNATFFKIFTNCTQNGFKNLVNLVKKSLIIKIDDKSVREQANAGCERVFENKAVSEQILKQCLFDLHFAYIQDPMPSNTLGA